ncbi:fanconi-associated nuclease 1 [Aspergillus undulatus]|uniref:fanconi-associated nuclease 1 n=1 Tax=Aspergillus undulatus TaxID=1810928 RepID=UPI003CCC9D68
MSLLDYWDTKRAPVKRRKIEPQVSTPKPKPKPRPRRESEKISESSGSSPSDDSPDFKTEPSIPFASVDGGPLKDDGGVPPSSQTDLESALPTIATDAHAIEKYESSQKAEAEDGEEKELSLQERMRDGKWRKGKSSIYVDAFNLALETVLDEEAHLFSEVEKEVFRHWRELSYESQYLYVRLFLRKTSAWHRVDRLGYYSDIANVPSVVSDLKKTRALSASEGCDEDGSVDTLCSDLDLDGEFRFADTIDQITTVEEASSLLLLLRLDELKVVAKEAKVQGKNKHELVTALHKSSQNQTGLGWSNASNTNREEQFVKKILDYTGDCIRLASGPYALFERVHLVFYRSTEWTEKSLTTIILAKISRKNFPEYVVCRSSSIFPSREILLEFESALRTQFRIDNVLEFNGAPTRERLEEIKDLAYKVYPRWRTLLEQEQQKEDTIYECGEGAYLRRFSPAWVYTRILHKGLHPLGRSKEYKEEHRILSELLAQRLFHPARRGAWYQRKALLEEHYMATLTPTEGRNEEAQKKHWRRIALRTCEKGLEDTACHLIYHYDLQKRIQKLEKALKVVKREQHDFGHVRLAKPGVRTVEGIQIVREDSPARNTPVFKDNSNNNSTDDMTTPTPKRSGPTIWLDELEDGEECRVETMCLSWYRHHGWKGYHSEGGILRTLFAYLFYDILFTYIPNVFQTSFQTCPLDLHTDSFYPSRLSLINHRLVSITNGSALSLISLVHETYSESQPCAIGLDWSFPLPDLLEIASCFSGEALAAICKIMCEEYAARGSGVPDLFLWSVERKEVCFVEVKSVNDRLSDTQRLWIHVLLGVGVRVELCNAVAREVRRV